MPYYLFMYLIIELMLFVYFQHIFYYKGFILYILEVFM